LVDRVPKSLGDFLKPTVYCQKCIIEENNSQSKKLQIFGYPYKDTLPNYDPLNKTETSFKIYQYGLEKSGRICRIDKNIIYYQITTEAGQSGCPLVFN
jgi:V8-like Glu-specific endopeptidase